MIKKLKPFIIEIAVILWLIVSDLLTKLLAFKLVVEGSSLTMIDGVFSIKCVRNTGASFGSFDGQKTMLIALTAVICVLLIALLLARPALPKALRMSVLFILGGAVGNLYDRAALGSVRDFISYDFLKSMFNIDFAIGNVADIYLLLGVLMLIVYIFFIYKEGDMKKSGWRDFKAGLDV